jgi:hypothetical protein
LIIDVALCLVIIFLIQLIMPFWWWVMVVPFVFGLLRGRSGRDAFLFGALSGGVLWMAASIFLYLTGSRIIAGRIAAMMGLGFSPLLIILTALIAAISSGIAATSGFAVKRVIPGLNRGID